MIRIKTCPIKPCGPTITWLSPKEMSPDIRIACNKFIGTNPDERTWQISFGCRLWSSLPYFSAASCRTKCMRPPNVCLRSQNFENPVPGGPGMCRRRSQSRTRWMITMIKTEAIREYVVLMSWEAMLTSLAHSLLSSYSLRLFIIPSRPWSVSNRSNRRIDDE